MENQANLGDGTGPEAPETAALEAAENAVTHAKGLLITLRVQVEMDPTPSPGYISHWLGNVIGHLRTANEAIREAAPA